ncbi:MAG TPA: class I SAM-dependent methyltransferase [Anaerolineae bacterium]|nr:class I SAM-dependent methyltransferase [Anaerolineae bacterium]
MDMITDRGQEGMRDTLEERLQRALWAIYQRPQPGVPWRDGENLPWNEPAFSERMLAQYLDQSHGAASRRLAEIRRQVEVLERWLDLKPGARLLDVTCGPGLYACQFAKRGYRVEGIDFSPASIRYAREQARRQGLPCLFHLGDVRQMDVNDREFDAAIFLYGQFTVFPRTEAVDILQRIAAGLRPGGRLAIEILDFDRLDKTPHSSWWYTDQGGLWGDFPYLHLGERDWDPEQRAALERFYIINLETGEMQRYGLADNAYQPWEVEAMLTNAGLRLVVTYPAWNGLDLYDATEWVVYVAEKKSLPLPATSPDKNWTPAGS